MLQQPGLGAGDAAALFHDSGSARITVPDSEKLNPKRITLRLRKPGAFGDEVAFIPQAPVFRLNPFTRNAIAERLIRRVDQLRNDGASR